MSQSGQPFFAVDPRWWPGIAEALSAGGQPWPEEAMLADLRWWEDQVFVGREPKVPGRRALAHRWNHNPNSRALRELLRSEAWKEGVTRSRPASDPPLTRSRPAVGAGNTDEPQVPDPPLTRSRPASDPPLTTRAENTPTTPPHLHTSTPDSPKPPQPAAEGAVAARPVQLDLVPVKPPTRVLEETLAALGVKLAQRTRTDLAARGWTTPEVMAALPPSLLRLAEGMGSTSRARLRAALAAAGHTLAEDPKPDGPGKDPRTAMVTDLWAEVYRRTLGEPPVWDAPIHRDRVRAKQIAESARVHLDDPEPGLRRVRMAFEAYLGDIGQCMRTGKAPDPAHHPGEPTLAGFTHPQRLAGRFTGRAKPRQPGSINLSAFGVSLGGPEIGDDLLPYDPVEAFS